MVAGTLQAGLLATLVGDMEVAKCSPTDDALIAIQSCSMHYCFDGSRSGGAQNCGACDASTLAARASSVLRRKFGCVSKGLASTGLETGVGFLCAGCFLCAAGFQ